EVRDATDPLAGLRPGLLEVRVQDLVKCVDVAAVHERHESLEGCPRVEFGHVLRSRSTSRIALTAARRSDPSEPFGRPQRRLRLSLDNRRCQYPRRVLTP